jgi:collagen type IV alpha-3-binding protein
MVNKVQELIKYVIFVNELLMTVISQTISVLPPCCENASCSTCTMGSAITAQHEAHAIDFKGEAMTFKATTAGVLATLQHCLELVGQREDTWRRRLEREVERRRKIEEMYRTARQEAATHRLALHGSPDYEVGFFVWVCMCVCPGLFSSKASHV